jgi:hypothetical protein
MTHPPIAPPDRASQPVAASSAATLLPPRLTRLTLAATGLVTVTAALRPLLPAPDPALSELLPSTVAAAGAVLGAGALLAARSGRDLPRPALLTALWGGAGLLLAKAADGIAFDVVGGMMNVVSAVTGDPLPIELAVDPAGIAVRWPAALAGALIAGAALRYQRVTAGRCARCGRADRSERQSRTGTGPAYAAALLALGYAAEKVYWGLGGTLGLHRPDAFGRDVHLWTPGLGDTAALALIGASIALALARPWGRRPPNWLPIGGAALGSAMLIPVGVMGMVGTAIRWDELATPNPDLPVVLERWVFLVEYPWFLAWGLTLAAAAAAFHRRTRGRCPGCDQGSQDTL